MKAGDNKEFWQRTAKSYGPLMKHSGKLYDAICERIRPGLTREMNVLELALAKIRRALKPGGGFVRSNRCAWKGRRVPFEGAAADPGGGQGPFQMDSGRV